jgi:hypothetical protein
MRIDPDNDLLEPVQLIPLPSRDDLDWRRPASTDGQDGEEPPHGDALL